MTQLQIQPTDASPKPGYDPRSGDQRRVRVHVEVERRLGDRRRSPVTTPSVTVVIPALNEARNLPDVLRRIPPVLEVLLVDGGSTDGTPEVARRLRPDVRVIGQTRRGKGNALVCGFAAAKGDIIVMLDADGSADPREIPRFVAALVNGADVAKGSRFASGAGSSDITPLRRAGNRALGGLVNALYGTSYTDLCYGYNAFWRRCLPALALPLPGGDDDGESSLWGDGFEVETLINVRVARAALVVHEVPSFEFRRLYGASNLKTVRDGLRVLRTIVKELQVGGHGGPTRPVPVTHNQRCDMHGSALPCCVRTAS